MKAVFLFISIVVFSWAGAQDLRPDLRAGESLLVNPGQLPEVDKASALPDDAAIEVLVQDAATLNSRNFKLKSDDAMPELDSISEKSIYHSIGKTVALPVSAVEASRLDKDLQKVSGAYRKAGQQGLDCVQVATSVKQLLKRNPDSVLQVVSDEMRANSKCSCEVVKVAIAESDRQVSSVVAIVKVAIEASPENMRLIAQCAIAECPEALSAIQSLLAKYEGVGKVGDSAKSAKGETGTVFSDEEVAAIANPLDFPGGPKGETVPFIPPPILIITPDGTTRVNP